MSAFIVLRISCHLFFLNSSLKLTLLLLLYLMLQFLHNILFVELVKVLEKLWSCYQLNTICSILCTLPSCLQWTTRSCRDRTSSPWTAACPAPEAPQASVTQWRSFSGFFHTRLFDWLLCPRVSCKNKDLPQMYLLFVLHYSVCLSSLLSWLELCPVLCVTDIRVVTGGRLAPRDKVKLPDSLWPAL